MRLLSILLLAIALGVFCVGCFVALEQHAFNSSDYMLIGITCLIIGKISDAIASTHEDTNGKNSSP